MVVDESIKMPIHFNCVTLQSLCKHGRPAGKSGDVGAEEEGGSSMLSREQEGYQVPQVCLYLGYTLESIFMKCAECRCSSPWSWLLTTTISRMKTYLLQQLR